MAQPAVLLASCRAAVCLFDCLKIQGGLQSISPTLPRLRADATDTVLRMPPAAAIGVAA
jgi:hypothetical protein